MATYRTCWTSAVALLVGVVALALVLRGDARTLVLTVVATALLGAVVGLVRAAESQALAVARWAARAVAVGVLVVGLPPLLGPWALLVLAALFWTLPALVERVPATMAALRSVAETAAERSALGAEEDPAQVARADEPLPEHDPDRPLAAEELADLSDRELERRWHVTSARLRHPGTTAEAGLALVAERVHLLDEIERRNPRRFAAILDRALGLGDEADPDR